MPGTEDSIVLKRVMMDILKLKNGMEDTLTLLEQLSRRSEEKEESWSKVEVGRLHLITPPLLNNDFMGVVNVLYVYLEYLMIYPQDSMCILLLTSPGIEIQGFKSLKVKSLISVGKRKLFHSFTARFK